MLFERLDELYRLNQSLRRLKECALFVLGVILRCLLDVYVQLDQRNILQADLKEAIQSFQY